MSFEWMSTLLYWGIHTFKKKAIPFSDIRAAAFSPEKTVQNVY